LNIYIQIHINIYIYVYVHSWNIYVYRKKEGERERERERERKEREWVVRAVYLYATAVNVCIWLLYMCIYTYVCVNIRNVYMHRYKVSGG